MKRIKTIAFSAMLAIAAFGMVTFTACNKEDDSCPLGYEGTDCQTESRAKFVKIWAASDQIGQTNLVYSVVIGNGLNVTDVVISNAFSDNFFLNSINATVDGNMITIPDQLPDGNGSNFRVSGTGTYTAGKINWNYTLTRVSNNETKVHTGVWQ